MMVNSFIMLYYSQIIFIAVTNLPLILPPLPPDHAHSDIDEGSSSGIAFLATSMRYMHTGTSSLSPVSEDERLAMEKFSPWALRDAAEGTSRIHRKPASSSTITHPNPQDTEALLKIYWSSIHPVRLLKMLSKRFFLVTYEKLVLILALACPL